MLLARDKKVSLLLVMNMFRAESKIHLANASFNMPYFNANICEQI